MWLNFGAKALQENASTRYRYGYAPASERRCFAPARRGEAGVRSLDRAGLEVLAGDGRYR